jgi:tRNA (cmo5U34)-methyltransferase
MGNPHQSVEIFEGDRALNYDTKIPMLIPGYQLIHDLVACLLEGHLADESSILIAGSGSGKELEQLGQANSSWQFLAVDPSPDMLQIARARVRNAGLEQRVNFLTGVVSDLPTEPLYDAATLCLVLHFFPDDGSKLAILHSIAQRLKPNAPFVLVDSYGTPNSASLERMLGTLKLHFLHNGMALEQVEEAIARARSKIHFVSEERLAALLRAAGFATMERFYTALLCGGWIAFRE